MINRTHRFHGLRSLNFVYQKGQMARGPLFGVKAAYNPQQTSYRLAVVISKKVHKSAVARNRMRRRIYESARLLESGITQPYDIVVTVFSESLLESSPKDLSHQLKKQFKELGIIGPKRSS